MEPQLRLPAVLAEPEEQVAVPELAGYRPSHLRQTQALLTIALQASALEGACSDLPRLGFTGPGGPELAELARAMSALAASLVSNLRRGD